MSATDATGLLPTSQPLGLVDANGEPVADAGLTMPADEALRALYQGMVAGRRFDSRATALAKQGRLTLYASSRGQEACQVGAVLALRVQDWLFPTYRDSMAVVTRDIDPVEALGMLRGDWHCGYDPAAHRVAPQCIPLATGAAHAVGFAYAARLRGEDTAALVMLGDGATSEGAAHEALNFAAVWKVPVVFFVQNNGYAISVPLSKQTAAPSIAHKGIGYGIRSVLIDGNDAAAVYATVSEAVSFASAGGGPTLIEAITYRVGAHTNADDASRYRPTGEEERWLARDPIARLKRYLHARHLIDGSEAAAIDAEAEQRAYELGKRTHDDTTLDPLDLFRYVYAEPTPSLQRQAQQLAAELTDGIDEER